ncbi:UDP-N-acetylmuramoyl-tripeptide--D-alanyl-D-alanine ligase [Peribacillus sp. SCS-26]|uniref:UDP-N-acetylmuramoyl-tripeptide--D-alanyl-D- alanine ligase n=1 Tax=Paraperibacillus marinus TaxID=3115295 RepID=UPI0039064C47
MIKKTLAEIYKTVGGLNDISSFEETMFEGAAIDTRKITPGNLFVPFKGARVDGHDFVEKVLEEGAGAALWQKDVPNPPENLPIIVVEDTLLAIQELAKSYRNELGAKVVGITGSNGKTTTKDMTASILGTVYKVHKTSGNYNNHLGLPLTILSMPQDTDVVVLEMGMSAKGEIKFLSQLGRPDVAVITNIGESHLLDLGSREGIAEAKLEIIEGLKPGGTLIYFGDEPLLSERIKPGAPFELRSFGKMDTNDLYPLHITSGTSDTSFELNVMPGKTLSIPVLGTHNVLNSLAAIAAAQCLEVPQDKIIEGLRNITLTAMRMEMSKGTRGETIINDAYNASPTSMKAAIELAAGISGFNKKYVVLGDMLELGPDERDFHYKVGQLIDPAAISKVYTFGELGEWIAKGAAERFNSSDVRVFQDKTALAESLKETVSENDLVLVKASRGMELEKVVEALQN